jgi:hypothetical protein
MKIFKVSEGKGELNFQVMWISLDGRLQTDSDRTYKSALNRYKYLKAIGRQPSLFIRIELMEKR